MLVKQLNILFFSFFFTLLISFSLQASSLQSKINQSNLKKKKKSLRRQP